MWHWAISSLLVFTLTNLCCCHEQFLVVSPNLIRTDVPETIFLQAMGVTGSITVEIKILNYVLEGTVMQHYVTLSKDNNYHKLASIQIPSQNIRREERQHTYIYLEVRFKINNEQKHYEKRAVMLSFQTGYIFIQTDKPIYRPGDKVQMRFYVSSPSFKASDSKAVSWDIKNPENDVIVQKNYMEPNNGSLSSHYDIPKTVTEGKWTIIARFDHLPQNTFNTTFEVKKYVLPAFKVTLTARLQYLKVDDAELYVDIEARYLFGETVFGRAYVVYGLKKGDKIMRARQVKKVDMLENGGTLTLTAADITEACRVHSGGNPSDCSIRSLVGSYVYIKVSVLTQSGGDLVEVEKSNIKIVNSPYVLAIKEMQKYFKPSHPFPITIHVTYHDGTPADNVPLIVSLHKTQLISNFGTASVSINMPNDTSTQTITVATNRSDLTADKQATAQVTVDPYRAVNLNSPNYLYINTRSSGKVKMTQLIFEMSITSQQKSKIKGITYLILSKGKILEAKLLAVIDQQITSDTIQVTKEMMPSFRIVAFYLLEREVVSDSIKLEVSKECVNPLSISVQGATGPSRIPSYKPGSILKLKIQGEPLATVSLVAVDQALYLLNKNRFTQRHILDEVDSRDTGCTFGSGKDAMGVFSDAGLLFAMKNGPATEERHGVNCPITFRRSRRSAVSTEHQTQLLQQFQEKLLQRCCRDGLRGVLMPYSCEQRSQFITDGPECIQAFLKCCNFRKNLVTSTRPEGPGLGRGSSTGETSNADATESDAMGTQGGDTDDFDLNKIRLRDAFQETWFWREEPISNVTDREGKGTLLIEAPVPDSITEWSVLAVSSSKHTGFCVAEPWTFVSKKHFFVDLKVPFSVARNEQVEINAVVYNYVDDVFNEPVDVTVVLQTTKDMCSVAFKKPFRKRIRVQPRSSAVVSYTIVPLVEGKKSIEVAIYAADYGSDRVKKELNVVVEGVQKTEKQIIQLNPSGHQGRQVARARKPNLKGVVPRSAPETKIKFFGNMLADTIENAIHDEPLARLIQMPGGCVEQNLAEITFPLIATLYLERTKGWEKVGVDLKSKAYQYIEKGYSRHLTFKRDDDSYPPYSNRGPSTWVTAYTVKVFAMIYSLRPRLVNINNICKPVDFLLRNKQENNGSFTDAFPANDRRMTGGLQGSDSIATLTAFVMIALAEVRQANIDCSYQASNIEVGTDRAVSYLKQQLQRSPPPRPYTQAIISYALALLSDGSFDPTSILLAASSRDGTYWDDDDDFLFRSEATGYALLALVKMGKMAEAKKPFDYLSQVRYISNYYFNTQNTMVILQALSQYLIAMPPPVDHSMDIHLKIPQKSGQLRPLALNFNPVTSYEVRSFNMPTDAEFDVVATGNGKGTMEVVTTYNQLPEEDAKSCADFDLQVSINKSANQPPGTKHVFELTISVKARGPVVARSVILDITLPTGFTVEMSDLENLLNTVERFIDHFYFDDKLSDRGSLIIHMYTVSNEFPQIVTFKLNQEFKVGLLQPSSVTVYEFYNKKGRPCTRLYSPAQDQRQLDTICAHHVCKCAQGDCCAIRPGNDDSEGKKRIDFACETLHHVFKVNVRNISSDFNIRYHMEITEVIKFGIESGVLPLEKRVFFSHAACTDCKLQIGSDYLIIGPESDRFTQDPTTKRYMYVLGKDTWVEEWPTATTCNNTAFADKCQGIKKATENLILEGCHAKK